MLNISAAHCIRNLHIIKIDAWQSTLKWSHTNQRNAINARHSLIYWICTLHNVPYIQVRQIRLYFSHLKQKQKIFERFYAQIFRYHSTWQLNFNDDSFEKNGKKNCYLRVSDKLCAAINEISADNFYAFLEIQKHYCHSDLRTTFYVFMWNSFEKRRNKFYGQFSFSSYARHSIEYHVNLSNLSFNSFIGQ